MSLAHGNGCPVSGLGGMHDALLRVMTEGQTTGPPMMDTVVASLSHRRWRNSARRTGTRSLLPASSGPIPSRVDERRPWPSSRYVKAPKGACLGFIMSGDELRSNLRLRTRGHCLFKDSVQSDTAAS